MTLAALSLGGWATVRVTKAIQFNQNCGGYLRQAANANTVDLAVKALSRSAAYAGRQGLTSGYTSVLWKTPSDDIGFWHDNLKASLAELRQVKDDTSQLERSNILIKLRESLTERNKHGSRITVPDGISIYPSNALYFWWVVVSCVALVTTYAIGNLPEL
jgi:hypothetical protein